MRIAFLGSPPFAVPILAALLESSHALVGVVTRPERPSGRGRRTRPSEVTGIARERGLPLLAPESTRDPAFAAALRELGPEALLVASYGEILREDVLGLAPRGAYNVHASLLPRWRGASPIQRAILAGDRVTGVTVQRMVRELDAGEIVHVLETEISPEETAGELAARLAVLGGRAAVEALDLLERGEASSVPQDPALVTFAPKLTAADGRIDWSRPALELSRLARAMNPWPGARTAEPGGRELLVERAVPAAGLEVPAGTPPGTVLEAGPALLVATGEGALSLLALKPAGRSSMDAAAYLRGARLAPGQRLGDAPAPEAG